MAPRSLPLLQVTALGAGGAAGGARLEIHTPVFSPQPPQCPCWLGLWPCWQHSAWGWVCWPGDQAACGPGGAPCEPDRAPPLPHNTHWIPTHLFVTCCPGFCDLLCASGEGREGCLAWKPRAVERVHVVTHVHVHIRVRSCTAVQCFHTHICTSVHAHWYLFKPACLGSCVTVTGPQECPLHFRVLGEPLVYRYTEDPKKVLVDSSTLLL